MREVNRIGKLFSDFYDGVPWTDIKISDIIKDITHEQAAKRPIPNANTIWQLVHHCVGWRENVLRKLQGAEFISPEDNYLSDPPDISPQAWENLLHRLEESEKAWETYLESMNEDTLNEAYRPSGNKFTRYEVIHGILHHDNYHFGQIMMLKKLVQ